MAESSRSTPKRDETPARIRAADFFAVRTPLLSFDELRAWSDGVRAPDARRAGDEAALTAALAHDRAMLRERLRAVAERPAVREAMFVASPSLDARLGDWLRDPASEKGQKVERVLVRYVARMAGRATPFGLFAGCAVGSRGERTRLELPSRASWRKHTRLDNEYVCALTEALALRREVRAALTYRPNSSLYAAAGRVRYAEARLAGRGRSHHLVAVGANEHMERTLDRARDGARLGVLASALLGDDPSISLEDATAFVHELIDAQLLVPELEPAVTGVEALPGLVADLRGLDGAPAEAECAVLERALDALGALDDAGLGRPPEAYGSVAEILAELPAEVEISRLFQIDMTRAAPGVTLGRGVTDAMVEGVRALHRLAPTAFDDGLDGFRDAFAARYEGREVPLAEALDDEVGVGFGAGPEAAPLIAGLPFAPRGGRGGAGGTRRDHALLTRLERAWREGAQEITLDESALRELESGARPAELPDAFMVIASLAGDPATLDARADRGGARVYVQSASGPSGANLLGRFCHADPSLLRHVEAHLREEEACRPDVVFAEIVHLPEGRIGNINARPVLRGYEIPYLGRSGAPRDRRIEVGDLTVCVVDGRIVLRSRRLGREVVPRMTNAHNFAARTLGVYRFLCALQSQGVASALVWDWGMLAGAPFLPRVTLAARGVVLSTARWTLDARTLAGLAGVKDLDAQFVAVQALRDALRLPRHVALADGDNELPIDLDNVLSVETFVTQLKGRPEAHVVEMFPPPDALCATGPEGRYVHELIVPFVRDRDATPAVEPPSRATTAPRVAAVRSFAPGSEWLFARLYTGTSTADQLLRGVVAQLVAGVRARGAADRWFFIRYGDPEWHLRLRFHGQPAHLWGDVLPALHAALGPAMADGSVWKLQLDTYVREFERYGGPDAMDAVEEVFCADSDAAIAIVQALDGDAGARLRWRVALRGADLLLVALGLDIAARRRVVERSRDGFAREFGAEGGPLDWQIAERYRGHRDEVVALVRGEADAVLGDGARALGERAERIAPSIQRLQALAAEGRLDGTLEAMAPSLVHMHLNRVLRSEQRRQELVVCDWLSRAYASIEARARRG